MGKIDKAQCKHQNIENVIFNSLKGRPYVDELYQGVEYGLGELDILYRSGKRWVYIEIKSNYTKKGLFKAKKQTKRYCNIWGQHHKKHIKYGIIYTPQKGFKRLYKRLYNKSTQQVYK